MIHDPAASLEIAAFVGILRNSTNGGSKAPPICGALAHVR